MAGAEARKKPDRDGREDGSKVKARVWAGTLRCGQLSELLLPLLRRAWQARAQQAADGGALNTWATAGGAGGAPGGAHLQAYSTV